METNALTINGQKITYFSGISILTAATQNGIKIPVLCHHPELKPHGACRICLVEDEKTGQLMASCVTPVAKDMSVRTDTPRVLNHRKNIIRLMMAEHPESCIVCSKGNRCELRKIAANLGVGESNLYPMPNFKSFEQLNPFIIRDLSKCILCGKCIRADHERVVTGAIDYNNRGFQSRPATVHENPLENSNCTFCGTCVSICPTGALSVKNSRYVGTPDRENDSICGFCGAGCSLLLGVSGDKIVEINPSKLQGTVNGITLCVKGHFANDYLNSPDRLTQPMIRSTDPEKNGTLEPVSWDQALEAVVTKLSEIKRKHGPQSIAFVGSSKCSNEENYLFQKIARVIFETNNVINNGYAFEQKVFAYLDERTHGACRVKHLSDLESAQAIIVLDTNPEYIVPVAGYHIKRAVKNGTKLVLIDKYKNDLMSLASLWIHPKLNGKREISYVDIINLISSGLLRENLHDTDFINRFTDKFNQFNYSISKLDASSVAEQNGVALETIDAAVNILKDKKIAVVFGPDLLHQPEGSRIIDAMFNLVLLTGSIAAKGAGFYVLSRENNTLGSMDMGTVPDMLPGRRPLKSDAEKKTLEKSWETKLPSDPGLNLVQMVESAENGKLKAVFIMGENLVRSLPQQERIEAALKKLDFIVAQDILDNQTVKLAHVILPAATFAEKSGSFTNMEGRIQTFTPIVQPPGEARADWEILAHFIKMMGYPEQYPTLEKIRQEIRRVVPMYQGLENHRQDWIENNESTNPLIDNGTKFSFSPVLNSKEIIVDTAYPITARIGSLRFHLGCGTRTSRSERINAYHKKGEIQISPSDCEKYGLTDSVQIKIKSPYGTIQREYEIDKGMPPGEIFIPIAVNNNDAMNLVNLEQPDQMGSYGWTACRVSFEKI